VQHRQGDYAKAETAARPVIRPDPLPDHSRDRGRRRIGKQIFAASVHGHVMVLATEQKQIRTKQK
jgi:hypothetical protein